MKTKIIKNIKAKMNSKLNVFDFSFMKNLVLSLQSQQGSTLLTAILISGTVAILATSVDKVMQSKSQITKIHSNKYYLETANESAIALASQLLGNSAVTTSIPSSSLPSKPSFFRNPSVSFRVINESGWRVAKGSIFVSSCLKPNRSVLKGDWIFNNADSEMFLTICDSESIASTEIKVDKFIKLSFNTFKDGDEQTYVLVDATTTLGTQKFSKKARLRHAETTKVCDVGNPNRPASCNVDHCKFMKPLRDANGVALYKTNGTVEVQVNDIFNERMRLTTHPAQLALTKIGEADPFPANLYSFYQEAYKRGLVDPFIGRQSIKPVVRSQSYVAFEPDGSMILDIPNGVGSTGTSSKKGVPIFDGFLMYDASQQLSIASPWPVGQPYSRNASTFKAACSRTLGTTAPDLCARINVNVKGTTYEYKQRRRCYFEGPQDYPSFLANRNQTHKWEESSASKFQDFSDWQPTSENKVGETIVKDSRTQWTDSAPHHYFGPSPDYSLNTWVPHNFQDIKEGKVVVKEIIETTPPAVTGTGTGKAADAASPINTIPVNGEDVSGQLTSGKKFQVRYSPIVDLSGRPTFDPKEVIVVINNVRVSDSDKTVDGGNGIVTLATNFPAGSVIKVDYKSKTAAATEAATQTATQTATQKPASTYKMRTKTYNWATRCDYYEPTSADTFGKDMTICFYVNYYNVEDRQNCRREVSTNVCRNMNGCFGEGTKILMADGTEKSIENMKINDLIYNPSTKKPAKVLKVVVGEETKDMFHIIYGSNSVKATTSHPFITKQGIKSAEDLVVGDFIADKNYEYQRITKIEKIPSPKGTMVWNLLVNQAEGDGTIEFTDHTFVANNLASGDFFVQQSSSIMKKEYDDFSRFLYSNQKPPANSPAHH